MNRLVYLFAFLLTILALGNLSVLAAEEVDLFWKLPTGRECSIEILPPALQSASGAAASNAKNPISTAIYLKNLRSARSGSVSDEVLVDQLRVQGMQVMVFDFHQDACTSYPQIHSTLGKLREELQTKKLLADCNIDLARVYLVPEGCRLIRDVEFARDGNRTLAMDIICPSEPSKSYGTLIEFSCDNSNRFGNGSLSICDDTLLDGFATQGFAVCMADHPVSPPYKGLDPMPECVERIRAAVRTLRQHMQTLGANGKVVSVGFSRGSGMALLLTSEYMIDSESHVDGAIVLSGRFTYLDLLPSDKMIPRYEKAWGGQKTHFDVWRMHGALDHLVKTPVPLFLSINVSESPEALHQMDLLKRRLNELRIEYEFVRETEPRGHKVPLEADLLQQMVRYLHKRLD